MNQSISLVYEDPFIIVVDKPQGIASVPGNLPDLCSLLFVMRPELAQIKGFKTGEGGLLNRLDNDTGGLILCAKTDEAFIYYAKQLQGELVTKEYLALVEGQPLQLEGGIDAAIAHHYKKNTTMVIASNEKRYRGHARHAFSRYWTLASNGMYSLIKVVITKGVRHQIRVHLAHIGCPIVGDSLYNPHSAVTDNAYHLLYSYGVHFTTMEGKDTHVTTSVPFVEEYFPGLKIK